MHVIESVFFHFTDGPLNRMFQVLGTTESIAYVISQVSEPLIGFVTSQGGANDASRGCAIVVNPNRRWW